MSTVSQRSFATGRSGHLVVPVVLMILALQGLAACGADGFGSSSSRTEQAEALTEYRVVPTSRAFVTVPNALVVMERDLGVAVEQRITLPNMTTLAGENVILLRAQTSRSASPTALQLSDVLAQFGGPPAPFTTLRCVRPAINMAM